MFGRRRGGDGQPPDQNVENVRIPEAGNIYRLNKKNAKGQDFVKVQEIIPVEKAKSGKARIILKKWDGKGWVQGGYSRRMLLETFLTKNDEQNYSFAFETPQEFYDDQQIPVVNRPIEPIRAFKDLGTEGLPPDKKKDEGGSGDQEELILTELAPEDEEEQGGEPEVEGNDTDIPEEIIEEIKEGERITLADVQKIAEELNWRMGKGEKFEIDALYQTLLQRNSLSVGDTITFSYDGEEKLGNIEKTSEGILMIRDENGDLISFPEIFNREDGFVQASDEVLEPSVETEPELTPEPEEPITDPEARQGRELKRIDNRPEIIKEEADFEARLGLSEDEIEERRALAEEVAMRRKLYVEQDFEHNKALKRILSVFKITEKPEIDPRYLEAYKESLRKLREFDVFKLQNKFRLARPDSDEQKQDIESYVARYSKIEASALWSAREELRAEKSEAFSKEYFGERITKVTHRAFEWYRNLSLSKKLLIGGTALGLQAAATFAVGPAAGIGYLAFRSFTAAAGYKAARGAAENISQKTMDTLRDNRFAGTTKNLNSLRKGAEDGTVSQADFFKALNKVSQESIDNIDKKLAERKRQSVFAKAVTASAMFGMPLARYLGMFDGVAASAPVQESPASQPGVDTAPSAPTQEPATPSTPQETNTSPEQGQAPQNPQSSAPEGVRSSTPDSGGGPSAPESVNTPGAFESVTITETHGERGLWGILEDRLPQNMPEAERARVTAALQAHITQKLEGLSDAQIQERYGFSSRDIGVIRPGEVIRLDQLITQEEYQRILQSAPVSETVSVPDVTPTPDATPAPEVEQGGRQVDDLPGVYYPSETTAPETPNPGNGLGTTQSFPEAQEAQGYLNSDTIGFSGPEAPRHPDEDYWRAARDVQGRAVGPEDVSDIPGLHYVTETGGETGPQGYTVEMSDYRALLQDPIAEGRNIPVLQRESMNFIQQELWDIDNTEFGPDHQFTNMNMRPIEQQYAGRPMTELLAFDTERYNYDPRVQYREFEAERRAGRGIYLPPVNPGPTLESGPDAYANATMDQVQNEYRRNIGRMAEAAMQAFGNAALPINTPEHQETVREYTLRIATLYTRARIENPNFRLNF